MAVGFFGCGLSSFGQFELSKVYCSSPDAPVTLAAPGASESVSVAHHLFAQTIALPVKALDVSLTWDATFIRIQSSDWTVCLASRKWAEELAGMKEDILKIWETNNGYLFKLANGSVIFKSQSGKSAGTNNVISVDIEQYCLLTEGVAYALLSDGSLYQCQLDPILSLTPIFPNRHVKQISNGTDHVVFVTGDGCVYSFGVGTRGQLGHGDLAQRECPSLIEALAGIKITSISCGNWHSMCLSEHGDVYSWGINDHGQLGHAPTDETICPLPRLVTVAGDEEEFTAISCGSRHSAALGRDNATLYVWGWDKYDQSFDRKISNIKYFACGPWCTLYMK